MSIFTESELQSMTHEKFEQWAEDKDASLVELAIAEINGHQIETEDRKQQEAQLAADKMRSEKELSSRARWVQNRFVKGNPWFNPNQTDADLLWGRVIHNYNVSNNDELLKKFLNEFDGSQQWLSDFAEELGQALQAAALELWNEHRFVAADYNNGVHTPLSVFEGNMPAKRKPKTAVSKEVQRQLDEDRAYRMPLEQLEAECGRAMDDPVNVEAARVREAAAGDRSGAIMPGWSSPLLDNPNASNEEPVVSESPNALFWSSALPPKPKK